MTQKGKTYRKIPPGILREKSNLKGKKFLIGTVLSFSEDDANNLRKFGVSKIGDTYEYLPKSGKSGKRNTEDVEIIRKDLPKIWKSIYLGERPIYGDYDNGTFSCYIDKEVYVRELSGAKYWIIKIEAEKLKDSKIGLKCYLLQEFDDNTPEEDLLLGVNLINGEFGSVHILEIGADIHEYIPTQKVDWEIFPPGTREEDIERISKKFGNLTEAQKAEIKDRYDFFKQLGVIEYIQSGLSGGYFGAKLDENLVIFENIRYGNAIYLLLDDWVEMSKKSRTEILSMDSSKYERIPHLKDWKEQVKHYISKHRNSNGW